MARGKPNKNKGSGSAQMNMWGMLRDLGMSAINKGQLPLLGGVLFIIILALKLPAEDASKLLFAILNIGAYYHKTGWIATIFVTLSWTYHAKRMRIKHSREMKRITDEKTLLQEQGIGGDLPSSNQQQ